MTARRAPNRPVKRSSLPQVVLGIDAAWTHTNPSGVALLRSHGRRWDCVALAPSYASFIAASRGQPVAWSSRQAASAPDGRELVRAAHRLAGHAPDVIAIDMPLSMLPITKRRAADDAISSAFGARGCSVHSPSLERPGRIADVLRAELHAAGYPLACQPASPRSAPALLEVFPHTALLNLLAAPYRVEYKASKTTRYWPGVGSVDARRRLLLGEWEKIISALSNRIDGITLSFPVAGSLAGLKPYEDALDALVCAWVGTEFIAGRATAFGDHTAAIWT